ncbi:hypothetical protein RHGRI_035732 [Rhododendron griersonianum]|uniref:Uncharacterized protein n=1 Tax=Rhododendron griersonianum TaxID=479676 RepID=A0AAV6HK97_9ERIC|nr:hypothetical protein RHGRI_035732 [Rhododendron griersonianum]
MVQLPKYVAIKSLSNNKYLRPVSGSKRLLKFDGADVNSRGVKHKVVYSKSQPGKVHIRCVETGTYWGWPEYGAAGRKNPTNFIIEDWKKASRPKPEGGTGTSTGNTGTGRGGASDDDLNDDEDEDLNDDDDGDLDNDNGENKKNTGGGSSTGNTSSTGGGASTVNNFSGGGPAIGSTNTSGGFSFANLNINGGTVTFGK